MKLNKTIQVKLNAAQSTDVIKKKQKGIWYKLSERGTKYRCDDEKEFEKNNNDTNEKVRVVWS